MPQPICIQMRKAEKVLEVKWHEKTITSLYIPRETVSHLDSIKIIPEEPSYRAIERLITFYKENNGSKK